MRLFSVFVILLFLNTSCDCLQRVSGTIIDKETGLPISGVKVFNKNKNYDTEVSDSTGFFEISSISSGFRCPPMTIVFSKENYKTKEINIPSGENEKIEMIKD